MAIQPLATALLVAGLAGTPVPAALVIATNFSTAGAPFTGQVTASDLINAGQATLASAAPPAATFGATGLNDGIGGTTTDYNAYYTTAQLPATATFHLNLAVSPRGYDLTNIQTFAGWYQVNGAQANQKYEVYVSAIGTTNFTLLASVDYSPFAAVALSNYATLVTLNEDNTGVLAGNVDSVRFVLKTPTVPGGNAPGVVYQEFDVQGTASTSGVAGVTQAVSIAGGSVLGVNSQTYSVGWRFQAVQDLTVTALGVYDADGGGLAGSHTVRVYDVTHSNIVSTVPVPTNTPGELAGGYNAHFVTVDPFVLSNGTTYLIAQDKGLDDYRYDATVIAAPGVAFATGVGVAGNLPATAAGFDIVRSSSYFGPNFKFAAPTALVALAVSAPPARAIYQRDSNNVAQVRIAGTFAGPVSLIEARALVRAGSPGSNTDWIVVAAAPVGGAYSNSIPVAGGWYDIEVRAFSNGVPAVTARVERVGAGENFITAGQSNAANYGAPQQHPADDGVNALNLNTLQWQRADDPQPYATTGAGGSPWPVFGDLLALRYGVPVGVVAVAVGTTRVSHWSPPGGHVTRITAAITALRPYGFRAILWHQGESDSIIGTTPATYAGLLTNIINRTRTDAGFEVPWGVALASYHPDPTATPANQAQVVAGQWLVISNHPAVFKGAETDDFHTRDWLSDTVHFNDPGLHDHGRQWALAVEAAMLSADRDGDGVADLWSQRYFGHPEGQADDLSRAGDDADSDGLSNRDELRAGTDPRDAASALRISGWSVTGGVANVTWAAVPGRTYLVESASTLVAPTWSNVQDSLAFYSSTGRVADPNLAAQPSANLYRVRLTP